MNPLSFMRSTLREILLMFGYPKHMVRKITLNVILEWDEESRIWIATSEDLPGLVTEADTVPGAIQRVMEIAPELIDDNWLGGKDDDITLDLVPSYRKNIHARA